MTNVQSNMHALQVLHCSMFVRFHSVNFCVSLRATCHVASILPFDQSVLHIAFALGRFAFLPSVVGRRHLLMWYAICCAANEIQLTYQCEAYIALNIPKGTL